MPTPRRKFQGGARGVLKAKYEPKTGISRREGGFKPKTPPWIPLHGRATDIFWNNTLFLQCDSFNRATQHFFANIRQIQNKKNVVVSFSDQ